MLTELFLSLLLLGNPSAKAPKKNDITLTAFPKFRQSHPTDPKPINLRLTIKDATPEYWCPAIQWEWPDGTKSIEESECDTYAEADPVDISRQSWSRDIVFPPGQWEVTVTILRNNKVLKVMHVKVLFTGGS